MPQVYGGYVTSLLVSVEESPVKCGAVLSPITDFELYGKLQPLSQAPNKYLCTFVVLGWGSAARKLFKRREEERRIANLAPLPHSWEFSPCTRSTWGDRHTTNPITPAPDKVNSTSLTSATKGIWCVKCRIVVGRERERRGAGGAAGFTEAGNCKLRRSWALWCDWFPIYLISLALPEGGRGRGGVRDMPWHRVSLELQMKTACNGFETEEYGGGWIYLNVGGERNLENDRGTRRKSRASLVFIGFDCRSTNWNLFSPPASAFSERYLGLPKPDTRAYTVRFNFVCWFYKIKFQLY